MTRGTSVIISVLAVVGGLVAGWFAPSFMGTPVSSSTATTIPGFLWPDPPAVEAFSLSDHEGRTFDQERLKGRWSMIYFGYTHCPDACPLSLTVMRQVEKELETNPALKETFQGVFVSVDPARDTLDHLGKYVSYFSPRFVGVTGDPESLARTARQFGVIYQLGEPDENGNYLVDHSSSFLLIDPRGRLVGLLRTPHEATELAERIGRIQQAVAG